MSAGLKANREHLVQELAAPSGWTAVLFRCELPVPPAERFRYAEAVRDLRRALAQTVAASHTEVCLLFERCLPEVEIPVLQREARFWMPQIGMGVWMDRGLPTTWTAEEFAAATPSTLRPVVDRVLRLTQEPAPQEDAWRLLAGSGALISISATAPARSLEGATEYLQPRMTDPSFTSFPFYVPLLTAAGAEAFSPAYEGSLEELLPECELYVRESVEDGGLLVMVRQDRERFLEALEATLPLWAALAGSEEADGEGRL